jgi:thiol-disulfide isomerase/thioredoxin
MLHHKYVFAALCCLCCAAAAADDAAVPASDVIDLTDASFAKALLNTGPHLVKFYSPNCGHCKAMAPVYEELATQVNADPASFGGNRVARMDCTKNQETCKGFRVTGFPRLMLIALAKDEHGRPTASHVTFKGARELPALRAFVKDTPDVKAAQEALAARQKLELEERGKRAKAAAERLEAMALKQEVAIAAGAAAPERRIVTAGNFDALFGRANATAGNALLLRCFVPGALQNAFSVLTDGVWREVAERALAAGRAASVLVGDLDCEAFEALCHTDPRLALPRERLQWPQIFRFDMGNMAAGNKFPGELYAGKPNDRAYVMDWALKVGAPTGVELPPPLPPKPSAAGTDDNLSSDDLDEL